MLSVYQARPPYVEFKQVAIHDQKRSEEVGRRVTKDVNRAFIMQPGSKDCFEIDAEDWLRNIRKKSIDGAHDAFPQEWIDQFQKKYDLWKQGQEAPLNGTSVKEWSMLSPAQAQTLIAIGIPTIEDVAAMTEDAMRNFGLGGRDIREKAREWLAKDEVAKNVAAENEQLKAQLAELSARLAAIETPKRGRPKALAA